MELGLIFGAQTPPPRIAVLSLVAPQDPAKAKMNILQLCKYLSLESYILLVNLICVNFSVHHHPNLTPCIMYYLYHKLTIL